MAVYWQNNLLLEILRTSVSNRHCSCPHSWGNNLGNWKLNTACWSGQWGSQQFGTGCPSSAKYGSFCLQLQIQSHLQNWQIFIIKTVINWSVMQLNYISMCLTALGNARNEVPCSAQYLNVHEALSMWVVPMKCHGSSQWPEVQETQYLRKAAGTGEA